MVSSPAVVTIARRFVGPPSSGNGGYTAGLLAEHVPHAPDQPVTVTLRRPPPIDRTLQVVRSSSPDDPDRATCLMDGDTVVAEAEVGAFASGAVGAVSRAEALAAESSYAGLNHHPFPTCFVCGTTRGEGDGLRLSPGPAGPGMTACTWTPHPSLADPDGRIPSRFVWAALDCPGGWTSDLDSRPLVLGRMTAVCDTPVSSQSQASQSQSSQSSQSSLWSQSSSSAYIIVARLLREDGRKTFTASSLYDDAGGLIARAEHVWIAIDPAAFT